MNFKKNIFILILFLFLTKIGITQAFPVTSNVVLIPPYSLKLPDYYATSSNNLQVTLLLNDLNVPSYDVKLRLVIRSANTIIATSQGFKPNLPITLQGGVPTILSGSELSEYLDYNNLTFQGISRAQLAQNGGKLPEGIYQFNVEVYDYNLDFSVSNSPKVAAWMLLNEPPFLNQPQQNSKPTALEPQNLLFQWTPRHLGSPNSAFSTEYKFKLVEVWPSTTNANQAILSNIPIYTTTTNATSLVYGPAEIPLVPGRKYAWQVQATDINNLDLFQNQGFSEVFSFTYGDECIAPTNLISEVLNSQKIQLDWTGQWNHSKTQVEIKKYNDPNAPWTSFDAFDNQQIINKLAKGTTFEYRIKGYCGTVTSPYLYDTISTPVQSERDFSCGPPIPDTSLTGNTPLASLNPNDQFEAYDYTIKVTEATKNPDGTYTGKGIVEIPAFERLKFNVKFANITINNEYKLIAGNVVTIYDKANSLFVDLDKLIETLGGYNGKVKDITINFPIDSVEVVKDANGNITGITVHGTNGETNSYTGEINYSFTDSEGNIHTVSEGGNQNTTTASNKDPISKSNTEGAGSSNGGKDGIPITTEGLLVEFFKDKDSTTYAFDDPSADLLQIAAQDYEVIKTPDNQNYVVKHKLITAGSKDYLRVKITVSDTLFKANSVVFMVGKEELQKDSLDNNEYRIKLTGAFNNVEQVVYAVIPATDSSKNKVAGKFKLYHVDEKSVDLTLVALNGVTIPQYIQNDIYSIYQPIGVNINIIKTEQLTINKTVWDENNDELLNAGDIGFLSDYSDEMKSLLNSFKSNYSVNSKSYYMFYLPTNSTNRELKGYMPLGRQFGFVFKGTTNLSRITSHELAHGLFAMKHSFDHYGDNTKSQTSLLMDYNLGGDLNKKNWLEIHGKELKLYKYFDKAEKSEYAYLQNFSQLPKNFFNSNGTLSFLIPRGKVITIDPKKVTKVAFATGETWGNQQNVIIPPGLLTHFYSDSGKIYAYKNGELINHKNKPDEHIYEFPTPSEVKPLVARPCYNGDNLVLEVTQINKNTVSELEVNEKPIDFSNIAVDMSSVNMSDALNLYNSFPTDTYLQTFFNYFSKVKNPNYPSTQIDLFDVSSYFENEQVQYFFEINKDYAQCSQPSSYFIIPFAKLISKYPTNFSLCDYRSSNDINNETRNVINQHYAASFYDNNETVPGVIVDNNVPNVLTENEKLTYYNQLNTIFDKYRKIENDITYLKNVQQTINNNTSKTDKELNEEIITKLIQTDDCILKLLSAQNRIDILKRIALLDYDLGGDETEVRRLFQSSPKEQYDSILSFVIDPNQNFGSYHTLLHSFRDNLEWDGEENFIYNWMYAALKETGQIQLELPSSFTRDIINSISCTHKIYSVETEYTGTTTNHKGKLSSVTTNYFKGFPDNFIINNNQITVKKFDKNTASIADTCFNYSFTGAPYDIIYIELQKDYNYTTILNENGQQTYLKKGQVIAIPLYLAKHLVDYKAEYKAYTALRIVGNGIAIVGAVASGGQLAPFVIAINSADIVMAIYEPELIANGYGDFVNAYDLATIAISLPDVAKLMRTFTVVTTKGLVKTYSLAKNKIVSNISQTRILLDNNGGKLISNVKSTLKNTKAKLLSSLNNLPTNYLNIYEKNIFSKLLREAISTCEINASYINSLDRGLLSVKNNNKIVFQYTNTSPPITIGIFDYNTNSYRFAVDVLTDQALGNDYIALGKLNDIDVAALEGSTTLYRQIDAPIYYNPQSGKVKIVNPGLLRAVLANAGSKANIISKLNKLGDLTHAKNFVNSLNDVADASLLSKLDGLDDATLGNLNTFYSKLGQNTPSPFTNTDFNFTATKSIDLKGTKYVNGQPVEVISTKQVSMTYKHGFPEFHKTEFCPVMNFADGTSGKFKYVDNSLSMNNYSSHFGNANESLLNKFGIQKGSPKNADGFYQSGNYRWNGSSPQFELKNANGAWEKYTWHHFEDGKTIYPVLSNVHTANIGGFKHAGGNSIFLNNVDRIFEFLGF